AITPDGSRVLVGSREGDVYLWDVDTGKIVRRFESAMKMVCSLAVSPDGKSALSGSDDKYLRVWDMSTGRRSNSLRAHNKGITCGTARLWNIESGEQIRCYNGHSDEVRAVLFSPDGSIALSASRDTTVRLWRVPQ